jgi:hypothetical protein
MLFTDCTKQVIVPCSSSLKENLNIQLRENEFRQHPKFNLNKITERNESILHRNNLLNKKKLEQTKKNTAGGGGFIAKWFGSDSGLELFK